MAGGYLSNDVSYRTVRLVRALGSNVRVGHIHTPRISGFRPGDYACYHQASCEDNPSWDRWIKKTGGGSVVPRAMSPLNKPSNQH